MDIACPNCAATYRIPEALLAQGKPLRCAACGEAWVPEMPPAPAEEPAPPVEPEPHAPEAAPAEVAAPPPGAEPAAPEPAPNPPARPASPLTPPPLNPPVLQRRPVPAAAKRPAAALRLAWAASVATLVLALAGLVLYGDAIAAAWPPFARVTALLGG